MDELLGRPADAHTLEGCTITLEGQLGSDDHWSRLKVGSFAGPEKVVEWMRKVAEENKLRTLGRLRFTVEKHVAALWYVPQKTMASILESDKQVIPAEPSVTVAD